MTQATNLKMSTWSSSGSFTCASTVEQLLRLSLLFGTGWLLSATTHDQRRLSAPLSDCSGVARLIIIFIFIDMVWAFSRDQLSSLSCCCCRVFLNSLSLPCLLTDKIANLSPNPSSSPSPSPCSSSIWRQFCSG